MPYDINTALQRLEQNLNDLTSARQQVEDTVKASNELQKVVAEYVSSIETLCTRLKRWNTDLGERESSISHEIESTITQLTTSSTQIVSLFQKSVEDTTSDFSKKTNAEITKFVEQNNKLSERVQELNKLREEIKNTTGEIKAIKESSAQISKDLKQSQEGQDVLLDEIKTKVASIETATQSIINTLGGLTQSVASGFDNLSTKTDAIANDIAQLTSLCQSIKSTTDKIDSSIQTSTSQIENKINEAKDAISKAANINRWILIAGIIFLAILQFVIR